MIHECLTFAFFLLTGLACPDEAHFAQTPGAEEPPISIVGSFPAGRTASSRGVAAVSSPDTAAGDPAVVPRAPHPTLATDLGVIGGLTALVTVLNPDVRTGILQEGSLGRVADNFRSPVRRALEGGREDDDHFVHNRISHPLSWGGMGYYLRERGYSRVDALLFTQAHSVVWEYVIEGSFQKPSGKDLVTNFTSSLAAIFLLHDRLAASSDPPGVQVRIGL